MVVVPIIDDVLMATVRVRHTLSLAPTFRSGIRAVLRFAALVSASIITAPAVVPAWPVVRTATLRTGAFVFRSMPTIRAARAGLWLSDGHTAADSDHSSQDGRD